MGPETEIETYKAIVEASFYSKMLEIYLMEKRYSDLKPVDRLKVMNIMKKSMLLNNRIEC